MNAMWWLWLIVAYLCGSVPFALLIGKAKGIDIRTVGSGNVGATNVGRALGRQWGFLCFVLDVGKGLLPTLFAGAALGYLGAAELSATQAWSWLAVGLVAMVGHMFPVWLRFRGGKGVATGLGILLGIYPMLTLPGVISLLIWIGLTLTLRYVSLSSMVAACSLPIMTAILIASPRYSLADQHPFLIITTLLALLVVVRHRGNIRRLLAGTEPKVGRRKSDPPES